MNLIHGGKEAVDTLCTHPDISAISFVGSSSIAKYVYALGSQNGKRVQAGGAAKNALVVMPDADPEATLRAVMSAFFWLRRSEMYGWISSSRSRRYWKIIKR